MYQALYRAWRPAVFSDVVAQPHITDTLRAQMMSGRLSHAYLFTGSRGTGKTTCAKILARAVNCEAPRHGDPCNECPSCRGILEGSILDVIEIDAASNSGVDNIRALREELIYAPVVVKKRVYIIDEVHMLSVGAFNALLKTLEEPPAHVLFILATTETHKVPATIVSRCQRFAFRRIPAADIAARLSLAAGSEKIPLTATGAALLARLADGSMRDGLSLLDQCASLSGGRDVDEESISESLGLAGVYKMAAWAEAMARGDAAGALTTLDELYRGGRDYASLLDELSGLLRDLLMAHMLGDGAMTRLDGAAALPLRQLYPPPRLLGALETISDTQSRLSRSPSGRVETELCVLRLCGMTAAVAETPAARNLSTPPIAPPDGLFTHPESLSAPPERNITQSEGANTPPKALSAPPEDTPVPPESAAVPPGKREPLSHAPETPAPPPAGDDGRWKKLLAQVSGLPEDLLHDARPAIAGDRLSVVVESDYHVGLLSSSAFMNKARVLFPGGVTVSLPPKAPPPDVNERLARLMNNAGDLITKE